MRRARPPRQMILLVLTGLLVFGMTASVGHPALTRQHPATQSGLDSDTTAPVEQLNTSTIDQPSHTAGASWNTGRGNPANTNHLNTTGPTNPITTRWTFELDTTDPYTLGPAGPVVANGTVYFGSLYRGLRLGEGKLYALNAWTGEQRWTFGGSGGTFPTKVAVYRNTVYVGMKNGRVHALKESTGKRFWTFRMASRPTALTVTDNTLYVASTERVYALGALRGEEKWTLATDNRPSGLAVKDGTVYASSGPNLYALNAETGAVNWKVDLVPKNDTNNLNAPVVANGLVYVSNKVFHNRDSDSYLYALDASTGEIRWKRTKPRADGFSTPAVAGDTAYFSGKYLHAVNARTGTDRWTARNLRGTPIVLNDIGYIRKGGADGALYTLNPETGTHNARFTPALFNNSWDGWGGMAVLNGSLYTAVKIDDPNTNHRTDRAIFYALGTPAFTYTNLSVSPRPAEPNEPVTVTATVTNTGTGPGRFNATLTVNDAIVNATTERLAAGTSTTVTFRHVFTEEGTATIGIANRTRRVAVGGATPFPTPTPTEPADPTTTATGATTTTATATAPTATTGSSPGLGVGLWLAAFAVVAGLMGLRTRTRG